MAVPEPVVEEAKPVVEVATSESGDESPAWRQVSYAKQPKFVPQQDYTFDVNRTIENVFTKLNLEILDIEWPMIKTLYQHAPERFILTGTIHQNHYNDPVHISLKTSINRASIHIHLNGIMRTAGSSMYFHMYNVTMTSAYYNNADAVYTPAKMIARHFQKDTP